MGSIVATSIDPNKRLKHKRLDNKTNIRNKMINGPNGVARAI